MKFAHVSHPSEFIREELAARGWTLRDLVFRMRRYESEKDWAINQLAWEMYMEVHDPDILLDDKAASELAEAFDVSPELFKNMQEMWRTWRKQQ